MLSVATYTNLEQKLDYSGPTNMHQVSLHYTFQEVLLKLMILLNLPQIFARVRIPAYFRSAGLKDENLRKVEAGTRFLVAFDTGSEVQTIERSVWDEMSGNGSFYTGNLITGKVRGATGDTQPRTYVRVEIGYFRDSECKTQIGPWRDIEAIYSDRAFEHNLSGREI